MTGWTSLDCNLIAGLSPECVEMEPFPHLVIKNPLPGELARQLTEEYPPDEIMARASPESPMGSNKRLDIYAHDVSVSEEVSPLWKMFIAEQSSHRFLEHVVRLFQPAIENTYPDLIERFGPSLERIRSGVRFRDTYDDKEILLDAGISINTPVAAIPTSVRMLHVDLPTKLFTGLYYLRPEADTDTRGGELQLCRYKNPDRKAFWRYDVEPSYGEVVKTIPYQNNLVVVFLNSINALHAVTPREVTPFTRKFVNLVVEMEQGLFDSAPYQVAHYPYRLRYYARQLFSWLRV